MAVVGTFASGLAHEVRNPLNSIALQLSILERRVAPLPAGVAGEIKELVGVIREEVKRLDNLVGDFLQFSRSNRVQYRPASLDVAGRRGGAPAAARGAGGGRHAAAPADRRGRCRTCASTPRR